MKSANCFYLRSLYVLMFSPLDGGDLVAVSVPQKGSVCPHPPLQTALLNAWLCTISSYLMCVERTRAHTNSALFIRKSSCTSEATRCSVSWPAPAWQEWYWWESLPSALASFKSHLNPFLILALLNCTTFPFCGVRLRGRALGNEWVLAPEGLWPPAGAALPTFCRLQLHHRSGDTGVFDRNAFVCPPLMLPYVSLYIQGVWRINCQDITQA